MLPPIRTTNPNRNKSQRYSGSFCGYEFPRLFYSDAFFSFLKLDSTFDKLNVNLKIRL